LLNVHNYDGVTPVHTAERNGHLDQIPTALRPRPPGLLKRIIKRIGDTQAPWS
jgi:ankyrin repeat protein